MIVAILIGRAAAAPHVVTANREAERLWDEAVIAKTPRAWRDAAAAFYEVAARKTAGHDERVAAARAAWAAIENALALSPPPPPDPPQVDPLWHDTDLDADDRQVTNVAEAFVQLDPDSPAAPGAAFLVGRTFRRHDQLDEAEMWFTDLIRAHPEDPHAEVATNLVLDAQIRQERYDEMAMLVDELLASKELLRKRADLRDRLTKIAAQLARKKAEQLEKIAHESKDLTAYDRCGEAYLAMALPKVEYGDELLYNAMVCFEEGKSFERARTAAKRLLNEYKRSKLVPKTIVRLGKFEGDMASYENAAAFLEHYAVIAAHEKDVPDALSDAILYRIVLGQLDRAQADLDKLAAQPRHSYGSTYAHDSRLALAEARLAAGQRAAAVVLAFGIRPRRGMFLRVGELFAVLACPVALVDERCPRPRDPDLVHRALRSLQQVAPDEDSDKRGRRLMIDLQFESAPTADLADRYRSLADDDSITETRIAAHARLAQIAKLDHRDDDAAKELSACITLARDLLTGASWMKSCERDLAALGRPPVVSPLPEHVGTPQTSFTPASEAPARR